MEHTANKHSGRGEVRAFVFCLAVLVIVAAHPAVATPDRAVKVNSTGVERRIALVIGNGAYQHADLLPRLANPAHDAEDVASALRSFGFEVILRQDLSKEAMDSAVVEFGSRLGGSGAALFYYAGHGIQVKGQNFLLPVNAKIESEAQIPYQGVNVNQVLDEMENGKSRVNIVMLDACRNNPISGRFRSGAGASRGLASPGSVPKGTVIVYATDPGNTAADGAGRNGLFTAGLLKGFQEKESSLDNVLTVASAEVERVSGNKQTPYVNGPKTLQKTFHFRVVVDPGPREMEKTFWSSIEHSTDAADFEAYLKKYPNGSFRELAENHLRRLRAEVEKKAAALLPAPAEDREAVLWREVREGGSREYLEAYLKEYPQGRFAAQAKKELKKIEEGEKAERARLAREKAEREARAKAAAEDSAWERAKGVGTESSYDEYLRVHPKGRYAVLADAGKKKARRAAAESEVKATAERQAREAEAKAAAEKKKREEGEKRLGTYTDATTGMEFVGVAGGCFWMGDTFGDGNPDEKPAAHETCVNNFHLGKYEVTQGQWVAVMGNIPSGFKKGPRYPVENVTWDEVQTFIKELNAKSGKEYRLPTEAEWEYAARSGGRKEKWAGTSEESQLKNYAWYDKNSGDSDSTHEVGTKKPNGLGLYDMTGNVWEWTNDWYDRNYYQTSPRDNPPGPSTGSDRVFRGGCWDFAPGDARAAARNVNSPDDRLDGLGFRLALPPDQR